MCSIICPWIPIGNWRQSIVWVGVCVCVCLHVYLWLSTCRYLYTEDYAHARTHTHIRTSERGRERERERESGRGRGRGRGRERERERHECVYISTYLHIDLSIHPSIMCFIFSVCFIYSIYSSNLLYPFYWLDPILNFIYICLSVSNPSSLSIYQSTHPSINPPIHPSIIYMLIIVHLFMCTCRHLHLQGWSTFSHPRTVKLLPCAWEEKSWWHSVWW